MRNTRATLDLQQKRPDCLVAKTCIQRTCLHVLNDNANLSFRTYKRVRCMQGFVTDMGPVRCMSMWCVCLVGRSLPNDHV